MGNVNLGNSSVDEETRVVGSNAQPAKVTSDKKMSGNTAQPKGGVARKVMLGAVSGIALGASGIAAMGFTDAGDFQEDGTIAEGSSDSSYDGMSFSEAFAAARAELGPGEIFEWHGNSFSTYTAEEWEAAHPDQPLEDDVQNSDDGPADVASAEEPASVEDVASAEEQNQQNLEEGTGDVQSDQEVEILGVESDSSELAEDVEVEVADDMNGDDAVFVDIDSADVSDGADVVDAGDVSDAMEDVYFGEESSDFSDGIVQDDMSDGMLI